MTGLHEELARRKRELRVQQATARDSLSPGQRSELSARVCRHAWAWGESETLSSIMAYVSFRSELNTRPLLTRAWEAGCEVMLPRVVPSSGTMTLHQVTSWEELSVGTYGIMEPIAAGEDAETMVSRKLPAAVFVPGLAFDTRGGRLGYGRGYYDRLRSSWEAGDLYKGMSTPLWIGLAYGMQIVEEVPMDDHDAVMDMLITEHGVLDCHSGEFFKG
ncbi:5-formyltetrahydrofolate cyclo-ligase [Paenibacillus sp. GCM10012306]|uniref:5-formyltetrahydrofolate cyclo-ligase n=1 Tax=Paenibacillus sp. GCM10012306 TaxID=3317342 RepID=UPI00360F24F3